MRKMSSLFLTFAMVLSCLFSLNVQALDKEDLKKSFDEYSVVNIKDYLEMFGRDKKLSGNMEYSISCGFQYNEDSYVYYLFSEDECIGKEYAFPVKNRL